MKNKRMLLLGFLLQQVFMVESKHILLLSSSATSHCLEMKSIGVELIKRGHQVSALFPDFFDYKPCLGGTDIRVIHLPVSKEHADQITKLKQEITSKIFEPGYGILDLYDVMKKVQKLMCTFTLSGAYNMRASLKSEAFDVAIVDSISFVSCFFGVSHFLSVPSIAQGSCITSYQGNLPLQANSFPHPLSTWTSPMSFFQRLANFASYAATVFLTRYILPTNSFGHLLGEEYADIDFDTLYKNSELFLENSDYVLDIPKATFPNYVQTGPLTAKQPEQLEPDLERFVSNAETGVIYVSFGSVINVFPKHITNELSKVFKKLKHHIIFKSKEESEQDNLKTVKWISQNDILGHNKTKLFISHCGKNSFFESLYHGVPIICTPLNADAFSIASKVEHFEVGSQFDIKITSAEDMLKVINKVIDNPRIQENMKRASTIIKDRPFTPAQTAANAIEHFFKYGSYHMKSPLKDLSFFSYAGGDIWLFIFSISFFVCWLITKIFLKCVFRH